MAEKVDTTSLTQLSEETAAKDEIAKEAILENPADEPMIKHPLENHWTLWYDLVNKKPSAESWIDSLKQVHTLRYIEDFWGLYNTITKGSQLPHGSNYHLFREGVKPEWEDEYNARGGKWQLMTQGRSPDFEQRWLAMNLAVIGEGFADIDSDEICGIVCSPRKSALRITLWTKTGSNLRVQEAIGRRMKSLLGVGSNEEISFLLHDAGGKQGSRQSAELIV